MGGKQVQHQSKFKQEILRRDMSSCATAEVAQDHCTKGTRGTIACRGVGYAWISDIMFEQLCVGLRHLLILSVKQPQPLPSCCHCRKCQHTVDVEVYRPCPQIVFYMCIQTQMKWTCTGAPLGPNGLRPYPHVCPQSLDRHHASHKLAKTCNTTIPCS